MADDLLALAIHLRERLVAHAERHIVGENEAVEMVGLVDKLISLANRLAAANAPVIDEPVTPAANAALQEASELAVVIGQFQTRMIGMAEYHDRLAAHARRLRPLLNAVGYPAPGSVPPK